MGELSDHGPLEVCLDEIPVTLLVQVRG